MNELRPFADRLLDWWDDHGRKDLPWQDPRTPYRVWVSEIMLQQTQVTTVIPYFENFLQKFPDLASLARAENDDVMAAWSGLGYYARARNLHEAARLCMNNHSGELPTDADGLTALPGIGSSTANAIISQTQDVPATVMDGNVKRVMARHAAIPGWPGKPRVVKQLLTQADERLAKSRGADYTQAIMDLGATLCTRSNPRCEDCPVSEDCLALAMDRVDVFPESKPKTDIKTKTVYMLIVQRADGAVLLQRRPPTGIWGGLWSLPDGNSAQAVKNRLGIKRATELEGMEHRLTHRLLKIRPLLAKSIFKPEAIEDNLNLQWHAPDKWSELGAPKPVVDILNGLDDQ